MNVFIGPERTQFSVPKHSEDVSLVCHQRAQSLHKSTSLCVIISGSHLEKKTGCPVRPGFNMNHGPAYVTKILGIPETEHAWVELEVRAIP